MKYVLLSLSAAVLMMSCAEKTSDKNTHVVGTIKGFSAGTVYLQKMNDTILTTIDSVKMTGDSKFKFDCR